MRISSLPVLALVYILMSGCLARSSYVVSISAPGNNATVGTPTLLQATVSPCGGVALFQVVIEQNSIVIARPYAVRNGVCTINASVNLPSGYDRIVFQALDSSYATLAKASVYATVTAPSLSPSPTPASSATPASSPAPSNTTTTSSSTAPPTMCNGINYGCQVTRIAGGEHYYSTVVATNADDTYILMNWNQIYNFAGNLVRTASYHSPRSTLFWSRTDRNILYYTSGNTLYQYSVATGTSTALHIFSQFGAVYPGGIGTEGDISNDGHHFVMAASDLSKSMSTVESDYNANHNAGTADLHYIFIYDIVTGTSSAVFDTKGEGYDYWDVTSNNGAFVRWLTPTSTSVDTCGGNSNCMAVYTSNMSFSRNTVNFGHHADRGQDLDGTPIVVTFSTLSGCLVAKYRLADSAQTCLLKYSQISDYNIHISVQAGWAVTSSDSNGIIVASKLDASKVVYLAKAAIGSGYWGTPRASLSADGHYVVFDGNAGGTQSTFLIKTQ